MTQTSTEQDVLTMEDASPVRLLTIPTIHAAYEAVKLRLNRYSELTVLDKTVLPTVYQQLGSRARDKMVRVDDSAIYPNNISRPFFRHWIRLRLPSFWKIFSQSQTNYLLRNRD